MNMIQLLKESETRSLTKDEAIRLLHIDNRSDLFYELIKTANKMTRVQYENKAYIFSQIGLNAEPCSKNCKFCSMAMNNYAMKGEFRRTMKDIEDLRQTVEDLVAAGTHDLFLMTTADYPIDEFLKIGADIKSILPDHVRLVANIGDFDEDVARALCDIGFTGAYHICRLGEGRDTDITPERRIMTLDVIRNSGLELYYCVEPIGPEHTYEALADEMLRAREYNVKAMAVMRRTPVPGTPFEKKGMISACELAKIGAVTRIVSKPSRSMNAHEVTPMTLISGINQLYAEIGANPRDNTKETANNRGYGVTKTIQLLKDAEFEIA